MSLPMPLLPPPGTQPNPFDGLVSVILASYNCAKTLPDSIRSLKAQTYRNIEIIVADDASTDGTEAAVRDLGVLYIRREINGGVAAARNTGAEAAKGDVILFGEADGYYDNDYVEKILRYLHLPGVVGAINLGRKVWSPKNNTLVRLQNAQHDAICDLVETGRRGTGAWAFHKEAFWAVGGYDLGCKIGSDLDLVNRLAQRGGKTTIGARSILYHKDPDHWRAWWRRSFRGGVNSELYRERWFGMKGFTRKAMYVVKYGALAVWPLYALLALLAHPVFWLPFVAVPIYLIVEDAATRLGWGKLTTTGDISGAVAAPFWLYLRRLAIGYGRIKSFFGPKSS